MEDAIIDRNFNRADRADRDPCAVRRVECRVKIGYGEDMEMKRLCP